MHIDRVILTTAQDSVPKFSRDPKYIRMLENRANLDQISQINSAFAAASVS